MPTLTWIGKDKVVNHHHDVPYSVLEKIETFTAPQDTPKNSTKNRIIHGDNLSVLKSLLPEFEGRVNCIYIDPPYNTGNEGWVYNDNVNDPRIKKWLGDVVGREGDDLTRHDKWLCMMYPRLKLLHQLLADNGVVVVSIDENELFNLKIVMDEIFGIKNKIGFVVWKNVTDNNPTRISAEHEYVVFYAKDISLADKIWKSPSESIKEVVLDQERFFLETYPDAEYRQKNYTKWFNLHKFELGVFDRYKFIDDDGIYTGSQSVHNPSKDGYRYDVIHPVTGKPCIQPLMGYRFAENTMRDLIDTGRILYGEDESKIIELKVYAKDYLFKFPSVIEVDSRIGTNEIKSIFLENKRPFDFPKSSEFIGRILGFVTKKDSIILDSFAGSGTTAHAVLKLNAQDGGNRQFILCEMMEYANTITAERVRRVMTGYGEGTKRVDGLGGAFDYYELGEPLFIGEYLNEVVGESKIRQYVAYSENIPLEQQTHQSAVSPYLLGINATTAWIFYYTPQHETILTVEFLATLKYRTNGYTVPTHSIIYADRCVLTTAQLQRYGIQFKKTPRDITRL
ncbi:MAG: site-specific DNA-methyltransferase [Bacteriovoracia bacterium]